VVRRLEEQTEEVLKTLNAQAEARNMSLAEYLQLFAAAGETATFGSGPSLEEFDKLLDQVSDGLLVLSPLPANFSREDIYAGHD
jgi:hypothetical protein